MAREDGVAAVAVGLGEAVVDGDVCLRFCPKYPRHVLQFSAPRDVLQNSQRQFYALSLVGGEGDGRPGFELEACPLDVAERDGVLAVVASTYSVENDALYDGMSRRGVPIVTFAPVLKHEVFPLARILQTLLAIGADAASGPVEIEFAVDLSSRAGRAQFAFLQLRPLALTRESEELELECDNPSAVLCRSSSVLGHGALDGIRDIVVVDYKRITRGRGQTVAQVARLNASLMAGGACICSWAWGVGDRGAVSRHSGDVGSDLRARAIIEAGFHDFKVTPSQGTHPFQNLIASNVGYFTVNPESGDGFVDWDWLASQPGETYAPGVRHLSFASSLTVRMNGKTNRGIVLKPSP
jgi:hypothetical protein